MQHRSMARDASCASLDITALVRIEEMQLRSPLQRNYHYIRSVHESQHLLHSTRALAAGCTCTNHRCAHLAELGSIVRQDSLVRQHNDLALEALLTQRLRAGGGRRTCGVTARRRSQQGMNVSTKSIIRQS